MFPLCKIMNFLPVIVCILSCIQECLQLIKQIPS